MSNQENIKVGENQVRNERPRDLAAIVCAETLQLGSDYLNT